MRSGTFLQASRALRVLCYLLLATSVVAVLGGSSCHVSGCGHSHHDDGHHDDDDHHHSHGTAGGGGDTYESAGITSAIESATRVAVQSLAPWSPVRATASPRLFTGTSHPRITSFQSTATGLELTDLRGIGALGPVTLGVPGQEISRDDLVRYARLVLEANADHLGLPPLQSSWELLDLTYEGQSTLVSFTAVVVKAEGDVAPVVTTLVFDGFGTLESVRHELTE
ncbi:MAG: hypothetical protein GY711_17520 [bacterium]|nr:hypothetical protein [bacterium]